jgi:DNA-binding MarR family transcriptional regulator
MTALQSTSDATRALALAGELRVTIGRLSRRLREEARPGNLTASQLSAVGRLDRDGAATVTTLARAEGVRPQSMGATISVLETEGLVTGTPDPADGRQTIYALTAECRRMLKASRAAREDWLFRAIQAKLTTREQEKLGMVIELLQRLSE